MRWLGIAILVVAVALPFVITAAFGLTEYREDQVAVAAMVSMLLGLIGTRMLAPRGSAWPIAAALGLLVYNTAAYFYLLQPVTISLPELGILLGVTAIIGVVLLGALAVFLRTIQGKFTLRD